MLRIMANRAGRPIRNREGILDSELIRRAQAGDLDAFDALVDRHGALVLSVARRVTGDAADAEDVAQESLLRLFRSLHRVDPSRPLEPWIVRITLNVARSYVTRRPAAPLVDPSVADLVAGAAPQQDERPAARDVRVALGEALATLPQRERLAFELRELEGLDTLVVAESLEISPVTVRRQVMGARRKLVAWFRENRPEMVPPGRENDRNHGA